MRKVLLCLLIALCCSGNAAKAQGFDDVNGKSREYWASPGCKAPEKAVVLTHSFEWTVTKTTLGVAAKTDAESQISDKKVYKPCTTLPKIVPKSAQRLIRYLDRVKEQCVLSVKNDCARVMFKLADENSDRKLTPTEFKKAVASAVLFGELAKLKTLTDKEMKTLATETKENVDKLTSDFFMLYDSNKSKDLDYNEIMPEKFTAPESPLLKVTLEKIGLLIPAFKLAASAL